MWVVGWLCEFEQSDKWFPCLIGALMPPSRSEHVETITAQPQPYLQSEGDLRRSKKSTASGPASPSYIVIFAKTSLQRFNALSTESATFMLFLMTSAWAMPQTCSASNWPQAGE